MQIIYLEKRTYSKQEIAELLDIKIDKNFKRNIINKLTNLGFEENEDFLYKRGGNIIILYVPQTYEEKITYLVRLLGIDKRIDPIAFTTFLYYLTIDSPDNCNKMPWEERAQWLCENYNINVSVRTLQRWISKLINLQIIYKDTYDFEYWCTTNINGIKYRYQVNTDEDKQQMKQYWNYYSLIKTEAANLFPNNTKNQGQYVFDKIWKKYHCIYYKCSSFVFNAWEKNPIMREIRELIIEHFLKI